MNTFKALVVRQTDDTVNYTIESIDQKMLDDGEVLIKVAYSSLNYKDMLAVQHKGGVIRHYPMIPGIDLSGTIVESSNPQFSKGQEVLVIGHQLGVSHTGGLAEYARVPASWILPLPHNLSLRESMIYGTAGFTAALSIMELENNGMSADCDQNILVTGATGGVGSIALQILAKSGYKNITALVRKTTQIDLAKQLGATEVILLEEFEFTNKPLAKQTFHYILDTVGGNVISQLLPYVYHNGSVSLCGNAGGNTLTTTVLPFILRGVRLLGIDSIVIPQLVRQELWNKLATEWKVTETAHVNEITLDEVSHTINQLKNGTHLGRTIVKIN